MFCIQPLRGVFYFGKVIMVNIEHPSLLLNGKMLIYIYDVCSDDQYSIPELNENHILCAPMIINEVPWRKGYFKNVGNMEVLDSEKQLDYGFAHMESVNKKYFDINDNVMDHVPHYCGVYGLASYRAVGGEIHKVIDNG